MKELIIKPGSIAIWKYTDWLSRLYRWFIGSSNYEFSAMYTINTVLLSPICEFKYPGMDVVLLEPIEQYNNEEINIANNCYVFDDTRNDEKLKTIINKIRPNTITDKCFTLEKLLNNKHYKVVYDSSKTN